MIWQTTVLDNLSILFLIGPFPASFWILFSFLDSLLQLLGIQTSNDRKQVWYKFTSTLESQSRGEFLQQTGKKKEECVPCDTFFGDSPTSIENRLTVFPKKQVRPRIQTQLARRQCRCSTTCDTATTI